VAAEAAVWLHARAATLAGPAFIADALPMHLPQAISECL
jgi:NAD(P)H-hydrate repair Nnr-like enzyme with NAD(P)H-hydrate dehydratase domain